MVENQIIIGTSITKPIGELTKSFQLQLSAYSSIPRFESGNRKIDMNKIYYRPRRCGVVLAGGDGKRLQPFVRKLLGFELPKQYVSFTGNRSMLEHTFDRAEQLISPECLYTVVARDHLKHPEVCSQLSAGFRILLLCSR
jgi:hypothetical protein